MDIKGQKPISDTHKRNPLIHIVFVGNMVWVFWYVLNYIFFWDKYITVTQPLYEGRNLSKRPREEEEFWGYVEYKLRG